eukprot:CAMPEP_0197009052 /NCGR_PEP_ID=MMETSP1380-20130617/48216_1 /TAXON_ID=5936 /ORGANISM="Euplotes crassus, Strain CT5" /LENGTH=161 /DNA_ID=CAMNT_0042430023 /DNA_START=306 /DNA_END=792 /DNA_ORIENTATION=-
MGTPDSSLLEEYQKKATHMEFDFPEKKGSGIVSLMDHVSKQCIDLVQKLLIYDPNDRITASQALKHPYFKDLRENDVRQTFSVTQPITYAGQHSDKEEKSIKLASKPNKKKHSDSSELPPIKKKEKKFGSYGKTMLLTKKSKHKYVSPYMKKGHKLSKFEY